MRRKDREVTDLSKVEEIIEGCKVCHIAMVDDGKPYVIPMNFGYELSGGSLTLYFHCAKEGRKLDILHKNNSVWFEMCIEGEPINVKINPCNSGYYFKSIMGSGKVEFVDGVEEKCKALSLLLKHVSDLDVDFTEKQSNTINVFKIVTEDYSTKIKECPKKL